jgi:hypothetical protein
MLEQEISYPLDNSEFLKVITNSFYRFLLSGTSTTTDKLKPLHGAIAKDIHEKLGEEYDVVAQGYGDDKEIRVQGRYMRKAVNITIQKDGRDIAGVSVRFVMQNYSQNANNYFEGMLGETANLRSNNFPYFQVFIILDKIPHYKNDRDKTITRWEEFKDFHAAKYQALAHDNVDVFYHTPNKTLICVVHIPDTDEGIDNKNKYCDFYRYSDFVAEWADIDFESQEHSVIFNNYETFIDKVYHTIKSI